MTGETPFDEPPHRVRVRYAETDRMGVAHHSSYVAWFEEGRTEWLRRRGKTYRQMEDEGNLLSVVELQARYVRSVTYDDVVLVHTRIREKSSASVTLEYEVRDEDGGLVATGMTKLACVGRDGRIRRLPPEI